MLGFKTITQYERGVACRFGRVLPGTRPPGLTRVDPDDLDQLLSGREKVNAHLNDVIAADSEYQASTRLAGAATVMAADPAALQLRLLQTVAEVAAEKNTTLVMGFPADCCASSPARPPSPLPGRLRTPPCPPRRGT